MNEETARRIVRRLIETEKYWLGQAEYYGARGGWDEMQRWCEAYAHATRSALEIVAKEAGITIEAKQTTAAAVTATA